MLIYIIYKINGGILMTIGSNIKQIRKEKKLTQSDLAKKINKGLRTVQKYE